MGGTGRSGTNIARKMLDKHSQIATLPFEYRFIIDPKGIVDFYSSYPATWSPYLANAKLKDLEKFLNDLSKDKLIHKLLGGIIKIVDRKGTILSPKEYLGWELKQYIPNFEKHVEELVSDLKKFSYRASWPGTESYRFFPEMYYGSPKTREELASILGNFLQKVFKSLIEKSGDKLYLEDNTWNILFAKELLELVPNAKIINVYRDPRDVVASLIKQRWTPANLEDVVVYYKDIVERWFLIKEQLPEGSYKEIKLEELVKSPKSVMKEVCEFIGLPYESELIKIDLNKSHSGRWKKEFSKEDQKKINEILGDIVTKLGYEK